ncbi:MAG: hypothetical protein ACRDXE_10720 [Acidimicrobiales bacterium]
MRYIGTIGPEHLHTIGARFNYGGREYWLRDAIGRVLPGDVGKRAYIVRNDADDSWVLQVENDRQRDERLAKEATP